MAIGVRYGISMAAAFLGALPVSFENSLVSLRVMPFQPRQQCGAKVEADERVVVCRAFDRLLRAHDAREGIRSIAFGMNALIPVVIGIGAKLALDISRPGILAWWLVEVSVNY